MTFNKILFQNLAPMLLSFLLIIIMVDDVNIVFAIPVDIKTCSMIIVVSVITTMKGNYLYG